MEVGEEVNDEGGTLMVPATFTASNTTPWWGCLDKRWMMQGGGVGRRRSLAEAHQIHPLRICIILSRERL